MAGRSHTARLAVASTALFLLLAATNAGAASTQTASWSDDGAALTVDALADQAELDVTLTFGVSGPPARTTLTVPAGFDLFPARPPGTFIGEIDISASSGSYGASALTRLSGEVASAPLDQAAEAAAQACSPGTHLAIWTAELSLLGQPIDLPIYVSSADPPAGGLKLDICAPALIAAAGGPAPLLPMASLTLSLLELDPPTTHGSYLWRAIVTPLAPDQHTPLPAKAYELRALAPVPHTLTLHARYQPSTRSALLTGRLTADGKPRSGVKIYFDILQRTVTPKGVRYHDTTAGPAKTNTAGRYSFRSRLTHSAGLQAIVPDTTGRCDGPSTAPAGCVSTTTSASRSTTITLAVPHH